MLAEPPGELPFTRPGLVDPPFLFFGGDDALLVPLALRHPARGPGVTDLGEGLRRSRRLRGAWTPFGPSPATRCGQQRVHPLGAHVDPGPGGDLADPVDIAVGADACRSRRGGRPARPGWSGSTPRPSRPGARPRSDRPTGAGRPRSPAGEDLRSQTNGSQVFAELGQLAGGLGQRVGCHSRRSPPGHRGRRRGGWRPYRWTSAATGSRPTPRRHLAHGRSGPVHLDGRGLGSGPFDPLETAESRTFGGHGFQHLTPVADLRGLLVRSGEHEAVASRHGDHRREQVPASDPLGDQPGFGPVDVRASSGVDRTPGVAVRHGFAALCGHRLHAFGRRCLGSGVRADSARQPPVR